MQICFWKLSKFTSGVFVLLEQKATEVEILSWAQTSSRTNIATATG
jgi:hypothetical protein